jgi:hypothetical protein
VYLKRTSDTQDSINAILVNSIMSGSSRLRKNWLSFWPKNAVQDSRAVPEASGENVGSGVMGGSGASVIRSYHRPAYGL